MTTHEHDVEEYLWDPAAPAAPYVRRLEQTLGPLRLDPASAPLSLEGRPSSSPPRRRFRRVALGAAAALILLAGAAAFRWSWTDGRPWSMTVVKDGSSREARLEVGRELRLGASETARIEVARIGTLRAHAGSVLTLRATGSNRHRLVLTRGAVRTSVWAPPGSVVFKTPAGDVIDLGCVFALGVDATGTTRVGVESGWVQLDNARGETLVPAGASSEMAPGAAPRAPVFDDAAEAFREGVRALEGALAAGEIPRTALDLVGEARAKDVITLLTLAREAPTGVRRPLLERAAVLSPPPPGVSVDDVIRGDRKQLWRWHDALDLPPPKSWWLHWRDAFAGSR